MCYLVHMSTKRKSERNQPSQVYLGDKYRRAYRETTLDNTAKKFGLKNRHQLIQDIADGKFDIVPKSHEKQPA